MTPAAYENERYRNVDHTCRLTGRAVFRHKLLSLGGNLLEAAAEVIKQGAGQLAECQSARYSLLQEATLMHTARTDPVLPCGHLLRLDRYVFPYCPYVAFVSKVMYLSILLNI